MNPSITLAFEPLVPWPAIAILGAAAVAVPIAYARCV